MVFTGSPSNIECKIFEQVLGILQSSNTHTDVICGDLTFTMNSKSRKINVGSLLFSDHKLELAPSLSEMVTKWKTM